MGTTKGGEEERDGGVGSEMEHSEERSPPTIGRWCYRSFLLQEAFRVWRGLLLRDRSEVEEDATRGQYDERTECVAESVDRIELIAGLELNALAIHETTQHRHPGHQEEAHADVLVI